MMDERQRHENTLTPTLSRFEARERERTEPLPPLPRFEAGEGGARCVSNGRVRVQR
jgi:hypothetical protein